MSSCDHALCAPSPTPLGLACSQQDAACTPSFGCRCHLFVCSFTRAARSCVGPKSRVVCRDLKGENILQSLAGHWVVCDFGSAQTLDLVPDRGNAATLDALVQRTTTCAYRAPEARASHPLPSCRLCACACQVFNSLSCASMCASHTECSVTGQGARGSSRWTPSLPSPRFELLCSSAVFTGLWRVHAPQAIH